MKKIILITVLVLITLYVLKQKVYKPYAWKKAINSKEHQLQLGSFIFSKQRGSNGSQSYENRYFVFKVTEINGDFVRLSVVRQLSQNKVIKSGDFSTTSEAYKQLKKTITTLTITPIQSTDLYHGDGPSMTVNPYLVSKYPKITDSRYYYEDIPQKNRPVPTDIGDLSYYLSLVYSKKEIIERGKLIPWGLNNSETPELLTRLSEDIDLIIN